MQHCARGAHTRYRATCPLQPCVAERSQNNPGADSANHQVCRACLLTLTHRRATIRYTFVHLPVVCTKQELARKMVCIHSEMFFLAQELRGELKHFNRIKKSSLKEQIFFFPVTRTKSNALYKNLITLEDLGPACFIGYHDVTVIREKGLTPKWISH